MSRGLLRLSQFAIDVAVLVLSLVLAFLVRFDGTPPAPMTGRLLLTGPYVVALEYLVLVAFGVTRFSWRYVGLREATRIFVAFLSAAGVLLFARVVVGQLQYSVPYLRHGVIPMSVLGINFATGYLALVGVRVTRRMTAERAEADFRKPKDQPIKRTLLIGAGQAGVMVAAELSRRPDLALRGVGFVDDDVRKVGTIIHGLRVLGTTSDLAEVCRTRSVELVLITMASAPGHTIRRIRELCEEASVTVKIIPGVYEIVGGAVNLSRIRDVAIEDLLGRAPVELDAKSIASHVTGRVVITTGAGGSIGSELCRQLCGFAPKTLVLMERAENALFNIHRELIAAYPDVEIIPCIADITDAARVEEILATYRPALLFHAAAHKHVPMMEWNPIEAIKNNVLGTKTVADAAAANGVPVFVMISTDKAVNPTSVMGATKRAAEVYVQALSQGSQTRFVTVRFGNVLGSAGSVIPIFQEQIERGGPVTVTHPDMRRYFMTIPEACQLVLQAGSMGEGGEIFILDMGEPVKIVDLARDLIQLSGLREGEDIEIAFSGIRPGEKLFEELASDAEHADKTRHPKIFVGRIARRDLAGVADDIGSLRRAVELKVPSLALDALRRIVPAYLDRVHEAAREPVVPAAPEPQPVLQGELAH